MLTHFLRRAVRKIKQALFPRGSLASPSTEKSLGDSAASPVADPHSDTKKRRRRRKRPHTSGHTDQADGKNIPEWNIDYFQVDEQEGKSRFHDFELPVELMHGIADLGFSYCTPIQALALPEALAGHDLIGKANTGTGKSAVFLITLMTRILKDEGASAHIGEPKALIIAPTRELVVQIVKDGQKIGRYCHLKFAAVYGGADYHHQEKEVRENKPDIVVATPGRLLDFLGKNFFSLDACSYLVIDEADRMLDMGFIPDVRRIIGRLPGREKRQTMLFSATISEDVQRLAMQWCRDPRSVSAEQEDSAEKGVEQIFYIATREEKLLILCNFLLQHPEDRVLIFVNMKSEARWLGERLERYGIQSTVLSGDVAQEKREKRLEQFRSGRIKVLVATDVAGRGIHVEGIQSVINYSLPYEAADYVHRIGRTGRAGASGVAISFACEEGAFILPDLENFLGKSIECVLPDEQLIAPLQPAASGAVKSSDNVKRSHRRKRTRPPASGPSA